MGKPNLKFECAARKAGYSLVVGVDEVGRGALAGPVVAGALPFKKSPLGQVDDSKRLSPKQREALAKVIKKHALWGIGEAAPRTIDRFGIVKGDQRSISIAAASILAKTYRDRLMIKLGRKYPRFKFAKNKGYGTKGHQKAIKKYGITRWHRKSFL